MDFTKQSPVALSVCPGFLGLERGLTRVFPKLRTCAYVEIEAFVVENILTAMEAGLVAPAPIWSNVKTFNPEPFRGLIDILLGGYPCQPFSYAGNRAGPEDPRHLWPYLYKIAEATRPIQCYFENVPGHITMGYPEVYRGLRDLGYRVESGIYSASEVGAPHERERLFILAILENAYEFGERGRNNGIPQRHGCADKIEGPGCEFSNANNSGLEIRKKQSARKECPSVERGSGEKLADAHNDGQNAAKNGQGYYPGGNRSKTRAQQLFQSQRLRGARAHDRFPAGQGEFQFDWEEPRTIESSLVYTIDGYNFTEDLHRAIGNSVVEQAAELAYIDLMRKHFPTWGPF